MNFKKGLLLLLLGVGLASAKDVSVEDAFTISLPDTAKERTRPTDNNRYPDTILSKYYGDAFQLSMYRWPSIKASVPLNLIPYEWIKNKEWASVSGVSEGKTDSGVPYVTFSTRITLRSRPPYDSAMTVLRSAKGVAYMFQMNGDSKTLEAIRQSIRIK
jgi:hypothetical protein